MVFSTKTNLQLLSLKPPLLFDQVMLVPTRYFDWTHDEHA